MKSDTFSNARYYGGFEILPHKAVVSAFTTSMDLKICEYINLTLTAWLIFNFH